MELLPLGKNVIIKPDNVETEIHGILIPETSEKRPETGLVLSVGQYVEGIAAGDRVVYRKYGPDEVNVNGEKVFVLSIEDIIAIIK